MVNGDGSVCKRSRDCFFIGVVFCDVKQGFLENGLKNQAVSLENKPIEFKQEIPPPW